LPPLLLLLLLLLNGQYQLALLLLLLLLMFVGCPSATSGTVVMPETVGNPVAAAGSKAGASPLPLPLLPHHHQLLLLPPLLSSASVKGSGVEASAFAGRGRRPAATAAAAACPGACASCVMLV
jgi:hypothetical protein